MWYKLHFNICILYIFRVDPIVEFINHNISGACVAFFLSPSYFVYVRRTMPCERTKLCQTLIRSTRRFFGASNFFFHPSKTTGFHCIHLRPVLYLLFSSF